MVLKLEDRYPGRATPATPEYPGGAVKNESTGGMNDGTPLEKDWSNDREGFFQAILKAVGSEPNGEVDTALKSQVATAILTAAYGTTKPRTATPKSICSGFNLYDNAAFPFLSPNRSAAIAQPRCACVAWDYEYDRPQLLIVTAVSDELVAVPCWDYENTPAPGSAWSISITPYTYHSIVADGEFVYIAYSTSSSSNTFVSKFALNPWTGTPIWTADTGSQTTPTDCLIVADDDNLAMLSDHGTTDWFVSIINKSTGGVSIGQGNAPSGHELAASVRITSNGTYVFWGTVDGSNSYLCSAAISDPTSSPYTAPFLTTGGEFSDMVAVTPDTIVVISRATTSYNPMIYAYRPVAGEFVLIGYVTTPNANLGEDSYWPLFVFDGIRLHFTHKIRGTENDNPSTVFRHMDATRCLLNMDLGTNLTLPITPMGDSAYDGDVSPSYWPLFDGRDVWMVYQDETDYFLSRLQAPGIRGT